MNSISQTTRPDAVTVRVLSERDARQEQAIVRKTSLSAHDAWGVLHEIDVEWRAQIVPGVALGHANIGQSPIVWVDHPPVSLQRSNRHGGVIRRTPAVQVTFERTAVVEGLKQDSGRLDPGCYRVVAEREIP